MRSPAEKHIEKASAHLEALQRHAGYFRVKTRDLEHWARRDGLDCTPEMSHFLLCAREFTRKVGDLAAIASVIRRDTLTQLQKVAEQARVMEDDHDGP